MKKFKCIICNEVIEGDGPPDVCPVCGVGKDKFIEIIEKEVSYKKDSEEKFVIVGNGAAGFYAADTIRKINKTCKIIMISNEEEITYYRPALSDKINNDSKDDFYVEDINWYKENNIELILGAEVEKIDEDNKSLVLNSKDIESVDYDKLIIATGSRNFVPPMNGHDLENVYTLRNFKDLNNIKEALNVCKKIVVIGGGLLGLEAAWELKLKGLEVVVVEAMDSILSKQLDKEGSLILQESIINSGIDMKLSVAVDSIEGNKKVEKVRFKDGSSIDCDMVIFSIGVRANTNIAKDTSIKIDRGILVDERMKTSSNDIFACGDVVQLEGGNLAIWPVAVEMGKVAGANACGEKVTYINDSYPVSLGAMNTQVFSIGNIIDSDRTICLNDSKRKVYKKLFMKDDVLVAAILINDLSVTVKVMNLIEKKGNINDILEAKIF